MELKNMLSKFRSLKGLHYIVILASVAAIMFLYYTYMQTLSNDPGYWLAWFWQIFLFEFKYYLIGVLLNIPILYSVFALGWKISAVLILIIVISITPYALTFSFHGPALFLTYAILIIPAAIVVSTELIIEARAKEKKVLADKEKQRITLVRQKIKANEDERKRIAQELHDGIIQNVLLNASIAHELVLTHSSKTTSVLEKELSIIEKNSLNTANEIRNICHDLMPSMLDNLGLISAIRWFADCLHEEMGINVNLSIEGSVYKLEKEENVGLFRLVQETLNNVRRHSAATKVDIFVEFQDSGISITIKDNGKGFNLPENVGSLASTGRLGMINMYERAQSIGANLEICSKVGIGTTVGIILKKNGKYL